MASADPAPSHEATTFHDVDLGPYPEVKNVPTSVMLTCATA